ncbi:MAG TPA: CRTAC1 family protein, partial [Saprospiraceae bacterium]|nr:CRTAC1 family protein [Saprospiraceae bacterium]
MERNHHWYIIVIFLCTSLYGVAQPSFVDKTRSFKKNIPTRSVMPGGIADIDGDLVDDLIIIDRGLHLKTVKSSGNIFSLESIDSSRITNNSLWTLTMGDLNNDGINEVITAGEYTRIQITSLNNGQIESTSIDGDFFAQASNTIDINNDGWLDYFVCDDNAPPVIYLNDKNGNLTLTDVIDFTLNDNTDGSGNYGSEWVDVNGDNLPDLCIAKCRAGVDSPNDLRRINRLYINNGDGTFSEKGQEFNLNSGAQTWVTTFGDIDNDGDLDAFVVNHYAPHALMENIDGTHFMEIPLPTTLQSFGFQSIMRDFDNDGYLDIIMSGAEGTTLLYNRGNKTFDIIYNILGPSKAPSLVAGDLNDDGFLDIHAHISIPINEVGVKDDELWINQGNDNNFVKINLDGKVSNRSGIAAKIEIYGAWGRQMRYVKGGESYGIFNSFQQHFGLGQHEIIDSLIVTWPSGIIDKHINLDVNKTYFVQEDKCMTATITLYDEVRKFTNSAISIAALDGFESYLWNDGSTTKNIMVDKEGTFHVKMTDANGCVTISKPIIVKSGCFAADTKLIDEASSITLCAGRDIELSSVL